MTTQTKLLLPPPYTLGQNPYFDQFFWYILLPFEWIVNFEEKNLEFGQTTPPLISTLPVFCPSFTSMVSLLLWHKCARPLLTPVGSVGPPWGAPTVMEPL